jgi:hypothetical protein
MVYPCNLSILTLCFHFLVSKMANKRRAMYDGFSDTGKHSAKCVQITKEFLKLAFASGRREASCSCSRCENKRMLSEYEMSAQLAKKGFMLNYLLWHQYGEVQRAVADESDGNDDVDQMDDMVADIGRGHDLDSKDPPPEVQNFYRLLAASENGAQWHCCDCIAGCDPSYGIQIKVQIFKSVLQ